MRQEKMKTTLETEGIMNIKLKFRLFFLQEVFLCRSLLVIDRVNP